MAQNIRVELKGMPELFATLDKTERRIANREIIKGLRAAAKPMLAEMKRRVFVKSGILKKSIRTRILKSRGRLPHAVFIGPWPRYKGFMEKGFYYAPLVEYGYVTKTGRHIPARPFVRSAWDHKRDDALRIMRGIIDDYVAEVNRRGAA